MYVCALSRRADLTTARHTTQAFKVNAAYQVGLMLNVLILEGNNGPGSVSLRRLDNSFLGRLLASCWL